MKINYKILTTMPLADLVTLRTQLTIQDHTGLTSEDITEAISLCSQEIEDRIAAVFKPTSKQWLYNSLHDPDWKECSDSEYEAMCHIARFNFKQVEV